MKITKKLHKKARATFYNLFEHMGKDLSTLTAAQIKITMTDITVGGGQENLEELYEKDRSCAFITEDSITKGKLHIVMDVAASISLTGLMMMMGEAVINNQVKTRYYNEEIAEGFQEVANQIVDCFTDYVEKEGNYHLFLEGTDRFTFENPSPNIDDGQYLKVKTELQVHTFPSETMFILLDEKLVDVFFGENIEVNKNTDSELLGKDTIKPFHIEESDLPEVPEPPVKTVFSDPALRAMTYCLDILKDIPDAERKMVMQFLNHRYPT